MADPELAPFLMHPGSLWDFNSYKRVCQDPDDCFGFSNILTTHGEEYHPYVIDAYGVAFEGEAWRVDKEGNYLTPAELGSETREKIFDPIKYLLYKAEADPPSEGDNPTANSIPKNGLCHWGMVSIPVYSTTARMTVRITGCTELLTADHDWCKIKVLGYPGGTLTVFDRASEGQDPGNYWGTTPAFGEDIDIDFPFWILSENACTAYGIIAEANTKDERANNGVFWLFQILDAYPHGDPRLSDTREAEAEVGYVPLETCYKRILYCLDKKLIQLEEPTP